MHVPVLIFHIDAFGEQLLTAGILLLQPPRNSTQSLDGAMHLATKGYNMSYVDGFVLPVPTKNLAKYRRIARLAAKVWREHGALAYVECLGDAMQGQPGHPFPKLLKLKPAESVVFGWGLFKSRKHRDQVNARVIKDKRLAKLDLPFDMKRMTYGGFKVLAES